MWYQQPIRPLDPVIEDDPQTGAIRYIRDNFTGTGQDSYTQPPAQDQGQWQALTNILPVTDGSLRRRWPLAAWGGTDSTGISPGTASQFVTRLYNFERDVDLSRRVLGCCNGLVFSMQEGTGFVDNASVFTPLTTPRAVVSRSTAYFFDGQKQDNKKWDASTLSNWGIDILANSATGPVGPNFGATAADTGSTGVAWVNPNNALADDGAVATATLTPTTTLSHTLKITSFGFAISGTVVGIKVEVKADLSRLPAASAWLQTFLYKGGTQTGTVKSVNLANTSLNYFSMGSSTDLWGTSWTSTDINAATFGVGVIVGYPATLNSNLTINVDAIRVTVYTSTQAITFTSAAGGVTLTIGRVYYYAFKNSKTGHYSDLSIASNSTGAQTSKQFTLTLPQPSGDSQIDTIVIMATADGGDPSILYQVAEVPSGTVSYTDNTPETTLNLNQQLVYTDANHNTFGLALNTPPPAGTLCVKHKGRLWMALGQYVYFSKSISDLTLPNGFIAGIYEEAWPQSNFFDISQGSETVNALFSDGTTLYIGTQYHIRRLLGDDPTNFQEPEILHPQAGVLNQEVVQLVYIEGTPLGAMWLTPDNRVLASDFNTVGDVGHPIQDILNNINATGALNSWATFASFGPYDVYILAVPTGTNTGSPDTLCVYDVRGRRWYVWTSTYGFYSAGLFNVPASGVPQWLVAWAKFQNVLKFDFTNATVEPNFSSTAQTSWMHLGSPTYRKLLDEIEVIGDTANTTVTVEGASTQADFATPHTVANALTPVTGPFGQSKVYLATATTKDRYYRFTFADSGTGPVVLNGFNIRAVPFNTL